jgi:plastocyanin
LAVAAIALGTSLACTAAAAPALAADAKIAIGHYRWSNDVIHVDLGQHVTWYWVGPDTMHSVTGVSANDAGVDSDPSRSEPEHRVGDHFQVTFSQPGVYQFQCKLHPVVHGEVVVSDAPGNPADDPDPIPVPNVDLMHPRLSGIVLDRQRFARGGTTLHYTLDDAAMLDAEIWHMRHGHRDRYAGWARWRGHIGFNDARFGARSRHFTPRPGHYVAHLRATDFFNNASATRTLRFTVR